MKQKPVIGDTISFGPYLWEVLDVKENMVLIITKYIIEQRTYNDKYIDVAWKNSQIRNYLNTDFYNRFSEEEKIMIVEVLVRNLDNQWYKTKGGEDTIDKIFLLSIEEVVCKYFGDSSDLLYNPANNQRYWFQRKDPNNLKRRTTYDGYIWWWWLRSPGKLAKSAAYIHGSGDIGMQGNNVGKNSYNTTHPLTNDNRGGVRPALWLLIK